MSVVLTYKLIDGAEQEKEFDTLVDVIKWIESISQEMFNYINFHDADYQIDIDNFEALYDLYNNRKEVTRDIPKYMFADRPVTPTTWISLQSEKFDCYSLDGGIALLVNPDTREFCYVFWDEAQQCSNPYPTHREAIAAREHYIANL